MAVFFLYKAKYCFIVYIYIKSNADDSDGKEYACNAGGPSSAFNQEDSLEKEMTVYSSIFAWDILWTEEPGGLQSMGLQRVGYNCVTNTVHIYISVCVIVVV